MSNAAAKQMLRDAECWIDLTGLYGTRLYKRNARVKAVKYITNELHLLSSLSGIQVHLDGYGDMDPEYIVVTHGGYDRFIRLRFEENVVRVGNQPVFVAEEHGTVRLGQTIWAKIREMVD